MDPSRIRLEDDRFGLIGAAFRPGNRAAYAGRRGDDYVWSIGIIVGPEDDIQTVEIDDHGAKSSRMLSSGELFEGLDILAAPGTEAYIIAGTFTLMGMELSAAGQGTPHDFAEILRAAADDHSWRLPLRVVGHPRDLQLSAQGRDILRETAAALERDGTATTSLAAARRLELSEHALDSIRRRISRTSLQAYRMHGRWYVVLDNLARSRTTPSAVEEAPEAAEEPVAAEAVTEAETQPELSGVPTEDDLAAFAEPDVAEPEAPAAEVSAPEPPVEPGVEYVEEEPQEEAAAPVAATETGTVETAEPELEAATPEADETVEPEVAAAGEMEELPSEPAMEESTRAEGELEEAPAAEPEATEEYRAAATTPGPASQIDEEFAAIEAEMAEQATEASVEDLAVTSVDEVEVVETPVAEAEQPAEREPEDVVEPSAEAEAGVEPEAEEESQFEVETEIGVAAESTEPEPEPLAAETAAGIDEPVVAEDLSVIEETLAEEAAADAEEAPAAEISAEETATEFAEEAEAPDATAATEPEMVAEGPAADELTVEEETRAEAMDEAIEEQAAEVDVTVVSEAETVIEEPASAEDLMTAEEATAETPETVGDVEPEQPVEADMAETVQSEEALLFAEMVEQASEEEPTATELEADVAEQSDQLIAERIVEVPAQSGEIAADVTAAADESEALEAGATAAEEPSDEVITEGIRTHVPAYADEVGRDELIDSTPTAEASTEQEEPESAEAPEPGAEAEAPQAEPEPTGGPSAATYFADARGGTGARGTTPPPSPAPEVEFATHLRGEVAFLRQQSREKDRQIGVWGDGAKWLQPFVDQIRSLEKQVERLGELQVQRENERISDLISERDALRRRLEALEARISATQATGTPTEPNRRSWFRRLMGSE